MINISIITPVYNRALLLRDIFSNLLEQTFFEFEWIIVDDGSTDNCDEIVSSFKTDLFSIVYLKQDNKGKHIAVNKGVAIAKGVLTCILDSDDVFFSNNILSEVYSLYHQNDFSTLQCVSVSGLCIDVSTQKVIGVPFPEDNIISDHIRMRNNKNIYGDKCEFFLTAILQKYPFPQLGNEKFLTEAVVWNRISLKYKTIYINKIFKKVRYLPDGLSANMTKLYNLYPMGWILFYNESSIRPFKLRTRIASCYKYILLSKKQNYSNKIIFINCMNKILFFPAFLGWMIKK